MNCMNCGAVVNGLDYCPNCGFDIAVQRKSFQLSNLYYNQGLEKAEIRDLSGAIDLLKRSLKFNKYNIPARNLLGLVYFETGEAVAALSEWILSKNIMPEDNIASYYIQKLQSEPNKMDTINQTIKKYNSALVCCREGNDDVAKIQLRKILSQNPRLIKGYHLLALIYLKQGAYEKARKILKKAARIDKTNSTTLRFLKEVDTQTGMQTSLESRWGSWEKTRPEKGEQITYISGNDTVIQPPTFRESSAIATMLNIGVGLLVGACMVWFLVVPAKSQRINREANERVVTYSEKMASQENEIGELNRQIKESNDTVTSAQEQIAQAAAKAGAYEDLVKAFDAYTQENYTNAANALTNIESELLSVEAKGVYDTIYKNVSSRMVRQYAEAGYAAYFVGNYAQAVENLEKAAEIDDSDSIILNYLAHSYRKTDNVQKAVETFQKIVDKFPGTKQAKQAKNYITLLNNQGTVPEPGGAEPDEPNQPGTAQQPNQPSQPNTGGTQPSQPNTGGQQPSQPNTGGQQPNATQPNEPNIQEPDEPNQPGITQPNEPDTQEPDEPDSTVPGPDEA